MKNTVRVSSRRNNEHKYFYTGSSQTPRLRPVTWQPPSFHHNFQVTSILSYQATSGSLQVFFLTKPLLAHQVFFLSKASPGSLQVFFLRKASSGSYQITKIRIYRFGKITEFNLCKQRDLQLSSIREGLENF